MSTTPIYTMPEDAETLEEILEAASLPNFLDAGGDLIRIPDIANYTTVILCARHAMPVDLRRSLAELHAKHLYDMLMGNRPEIDAMPADDGWEYLRQAAWLSAAVADDEVANRFESAVPDHLKVMAWQRVDQVLCVDWTKGEAPEGDTAA